MPASIKLRLTLCAFLFITGGACSATESRTDSVSDAAPTEDAGTTVDAETRESSAADGAAITNPIRVTYGTCDTFPTCSAGDPKGSWRVSGGCIGTWELDNVRGRCSTLEILTNTFSVSATGSIQFDGTTFSSDTKVGYSGKIRVACEKAAGGCAGFAKVLVDSFHFDPATTCSSLGASGCECDVKQTVQGPTSPTTYTQQGSIVAYAGGSGFEMCVSGNSLKQNFSFSHQMYFTKE